MDSEQGDAGISKPLPKKMTGSDGFQVLKEGFLLKTKRLKTITSIKQRFVRNCLMFVCLCLCTFFGLTHPCPSLCLCTCLSPPPDAVASSAGLC